MTCRTEARLRAAYDDLHVGIALYDPVTGAILDANERLESIFGVTTETLREVSVETYTANTHSVSASVFRDRLRASAEGGTRTFVWQVKRGDGELVWVRIHCSPRPADDRTLSTTARRRPPRPTARAPDCSS